MLLVSDMYLMYDLLGRKVWVSVKGGGWVSLKHLCRMLKNPTDAVFLQPPDFLCLRPNPMFSQAMM